MALFARVEGVGQPVVLIPGLGASSRVFDDVFTEGTSRARLLAIDLPRSGRSSAFAANTPDAIAEGLLRWLTEQGVGRFRLFGHSFGGLVAIAVAARAADRVVSLTVASAPALGVPAEAKLFLESPLAPVSALWMNAAPLWRPMVKNYLRWLWGKPGNFKDELVDRYLESLKAEGFVDGLIESLRAVASYRLPKEALQPGAFPRRVIWGERDPLVSVIQGERLATALGADFHVLHDVGHCVPEEAPLAVLEAILTTG
jgi:pyruvate dehydrogenase E2 component (dihydrolipoamide acetyltransferase)